MMNRFKSALHSKVHVVKVNRIKKQVSAEPDCSFEDGFETSSASDSDSIANDNSADTNDSESHSVGFVIDAVVDLLSSTSYFIVCIGEAGEPVSRKKRRGIHFSKLLNSRSPILDGDQYSYVLPLARLTQPEVTVRFSRSTIVGQDGFLGECHFPINAKGPIDCVDEHSIGRLLGGGNAYISCHWRLVPNNSEIRPNILPDESLVTDVDKLEALVHSVRKCIDSLSENDPEIGAKRLWISSLLEVLEPVEINHLLLRVPIYDLLRLMPSVIFQLESVLSREAIEVAARARIIKAVHMTECCAQSESLLSALFQGCMDDDVDHLKRLLNRGGDKYHFNHLIFSFLQSELIREQIILRFQQASSVKRKQSLHVLSEIDQVIHSPFGSVRLWPEGPIPGAHALYKALARDVTFISNKPLSFESWNHKTIRKSGFEDSPLLSGSKSDLYALKGGVAKLQSRIESSKYSNWSNYRRLFPEDHFVWFGESIDFAKTLMQDEAGLGTSQRYGVAKIALALVMGDEGPNKIGPYTAEPGVIVCANFIQAGIACVSEGILTDLATLKTLVSDFSEIITQMESDSTKQGKRNRHLIRERTCELKLDLSRFKQQIVELERKVESIREEMVDSIVLTPIEAHSPSLTDRSAGTNPEESEKNGADNVILHGI